jgi:hypothetical protein
MSSKKASTPSPVSPRCLRPYRGTTPLAVTRGPPPSRQGGGLRQYDVATWGGIGFRSDRASQSASWNTPCTRCTSPAGGFSPARKRIIPYSIQTLKRLKPALFRHDLMALLELHYQHRIKPLIAHRFPVADARRAQELLAKGGFVGKIVLLRDAPSAAA